MHFGKEVEFDSIKTAHMASEIDRLFHSTAVRHYMNHPLTTYNSIPLDTQRRQLCAQLHCGLYIHVLLLTLGGLSDGTSVTQTNSGSLSRFLVRGRVFLHRWVSGCPDRPATGEWG